VDIVKTWGYYNLAKVVKKRAEKKDPPQEDRKAKAFRPPQWSGLPSELSQLVMVKTNIAGFFFDAVLREEHVSSLKITSHPVQTGANITDHSYVEPAVLTMKIAMSDAMDDLHDGQFIRYTPKDADKPSYSKSVSAYRVLLDMQESRVPISVHTRLKTYTNMLIENITAPDDAKTLHGLKCTITLREIFVVNVTKTKNVREDMKHYTEVNDMGKKQAQPVDDETLAAWGLKASGIEE
jgi:hypothetical protein